MKRLIISLPKYLPALLPAAAGLVVGWISPLINPRMPLFILTADLSSLLFITGCMVSLILLGLVHFQRKYETRLHREVLEVKQSQDEAHRRFFRRLDHEVKNPLTAIRAAIVNLPEVNQKEEQARIFQDIQHQVDRLNRLVKDLRKLAELEDRPLEKSPVDLGELLEEVVETIRSHPPYASRKIQLILPKVPWPLSPVTGDRDLLGLVFFNLVENALKFPSPEDSIEIRAIEDGKSHIVEVADTGPGIPAEDLPHLFEELYRGANAHGGGFEGSGLGLALANRVITRHDGTISVRSRPGKGSVFTIRLPS
jgi:two-component system, OmpR family, sensor kinase